LSNDLLIGQAEAEQKNRNILSFLQCQRIDPSVHRCCCTRSWHSRSWLDCPVWSARWSKGLCFFDPNINIIAIRAAVPL